MLCSDDNQWNCLQELAALTDWPSPLGHILGSSSAALHAAAVELPGGCYFVWNSYQPPLLQFIMILDVMDLLSVHHKATYRQTTTHTHTFHWFLFIKSLSICIHRCLFSLLQVFYHYTMASMSLMHRIKKNNNREMHIYSALLRILIQCRSTHVSTQMSNNANNKTCHRPQCLLVVIKRSGREPGLMQYALGHWMLLSIDL